MQRLLIQLANLFLLVVIVIGIPAISSLRFGSVRLSSDPKLQILTLGGLGLAAASNLIGALVLVGDKKARGACRAWALLFGLILAAEYSYIHGYIGFGWLKEFLRWLQPKL